MNKWRAMQRKVMHGLREIYGVVVTNSGPGATDLITSIGGCIIDSGPILAFSGQVPTNLIGNDAFQEADMIGATMAVAKQNYQLKNVDDVGRIFKEAIYIATTGKTWPSFYQCT